MYILDATQTSAGLRQAGIVMGTPAYMSPEQVSGRTLREDFFGAQLVHNNLQMG